MKVLKLGLTLFSLFVVVAFSSAQNSQEKMTKEELRTEKIIDYIELDNSVAIKARALSVKYTDLINEANDDSAKEQIFKNLDLDVRNLLTEEQYKKYQEFLAKEKKSAATRSERAKGAK
jgi:hypothetical protein